MPIHGVIFDLDGTLVDSGLDFPQMRREMGIEESSPLLEALAQMPAERAARCRAILLDHELRGSQRAVAFAGVHAFLDSLAARRIVRGVVTRNSRETTLALLARLALHFEPILCREDAPAKPDPAALWKTCEAWGLAPRQCVMIGDFRFDIEAVGAAGMHAVLYTGGGGSSGLVDEGEADFVLRSFAEPEAFWRWAAEIDLEGGTGTC
jgi:HAD superfamily hydrolase (TIGR01509 family)